MTNDSPSVRRDVPRGTRKTSWKKLTTTELFIGSFLALILFGTLGLKLLPGLYHGPGLSWTDSVFMATSAVCVTGLIVEDTATYFTGYGQAFLLLLIQLGGLGMLVLTSVIITALGGRPSLRTEDLATAQRQLVPEIPARKLFTDILLFTILFESVGFLLLYATWAPEMGAGEALWPAFFHAISAFCNAGFSTYSDSLVGFRHSPATIGIVSFLIVIGGIGFVTIEEIHLRFINRRRSIQRLSVHSQLVLVTTGFLLILGAIVFAVSEWYLTLDTMSFPDKIMNAFFMSVTARTAGFNTINYAAASDSTNFLTILLMMIGGSPGSTAGGMKTTTFALIGLLAWSRLRSHRNVTFNDRSIPNETIHQAMGLFVIAIAVIVTFLMILVSLGDFLGHPNQFLVRTFEAVSAFNTVGLSMGLTSELSTFARWEIILLMFVGRIGPLSIAAMLSLRFAQHSKFRLAYEDVIIG